MAKKKTAALPPQPDPRAPLDSKLLLQHLVPVLKALEKDLLQRADGSPGLTEALQARCSAEQEAERTAEDFDPWRRGIITQVAAAWVLSCVFVRILEDRGLVAHCRIAGPGSEGSQQEFMKLAPFLTERDYLLMVFRELRHFDVTRELFDEEHNLVWRLTPSAEGAKLLLATFRQGSADAPGFRFGQVSTRFLGDLYQDLSASVRKKYALLQTPDFVENFILDRTLSPALETFGLDDTTVIDPTCGSGHFLLGAFERLYERQLAARPNLNPRDAAERALNAVHGTDINPYAVSIAKFRLMLAFLEKGEFPTLAGAPRLLLNVVVADSLYHRIAGEQTGQTDMGYVSGQRTREWFDEAFALEEEGKAKRILGSRYAAVIGNPPYINVKDGVLRKKYAQLYPSCAMNYALAIPFCERFFQLGRDQACIGLIIANSFMKREFGKKLVETFLPGVNLRLIVNASGAYIPGHGTPTVLLFGTPEAPAQRSVLTVLAKAGEPGTPEYPANGRVWASIRTHWANVGFENDYIAVTTTERESLSNHPWALAGGGTTGLKKLLEDSRAATLADLIDDIGFSIIIGEDDIYIRERGFAARHGIESVPLVIGENLRDWGLDLSFEMVRPYNEKTLVPEASPALRRYLWPWRASLEHRVVSGSTSMRQAGREWFDVRRLSRDKHRWPLAITFAFVATHNHFVLDRGGKVFKQSAPIIKLPENATEDDHYALLAYLNSSTACFWMKQVYFKKFSANQKHNDDIARIKYEFAGTPMKRLPLPSGLAANDRLVQLGKAAHDAAQHRASCLVSANISLLAAPETAANQIEAAFAKWETWQARGVYLQEEIDWAVYEAFGLVPPQPEPEWERGASPGARPFEIDTGHHQGFTKKVGVSNAHISSESTPKAWRNRKALIKGHLATIETPEFKRTWRFSDENIHPELARQKAAVKLLVAEVLDATERPFQDGPVPEVRTERDLVSRFDLALDAIRACPRLCHAPTAATMVSENAVPFLDAFRYTDSGLEKRAIWLSTWELQRREDEGNQGLKIPVPPAYDPKDFRAGSYSLRGKLDVPKERFISYPGCESDEDKSPVYGWAGWNHLQRAVALSGLYNQRRSEGWAGDRLLPMLVGLLELLPWLKQWHNEPDEELGGERPAAQFEAFVVEELRQWKKTADEARRAVLDWVESGGAKSEKRAQKKKAKKKTKGLAKGKAVNDAETEAEPEIEGAVDEGEAA